MLEHHVIIAGFGLPGRSVAESCRAGGIPFCVIELNPLTVERCALGGVPMIEGDVRHEQTLLQANIQQAAALAITLPDETAVLETTELARRLNPNVRIIARCMYTSNGLAATSRGADEVIVAEQIIAREFSRLIQTMLPL